MVVEAHIEVAAWGAVTQERDVLSLAAQTLITLCHTAAALLLYPPPTSTLCPKCPAVNIVLPRWFLCVSRHNG